MNIKIFKRKSRIAVSRFLSRNLPLLGLPKEVKSLFNLSNSVEGFYDLESILSLRVGRDKISSSFDKEGSEVPKMAFVDVNNNGHDEAIQVLFHDQNNNEIHTESEASSDESETDESNGYNSDGYNSENYEASGEDSEIENDTHSEGRRTSEDDSNKEESENSEVENAPNDTRRPDGGEPAQKRHRSQ